MQGQDMTKKGLLESETLEWGSLPWTDSKAAQRG